VEESTRRASSANRGIAVDDRLERPERLDGTDDRQRARFDLGPRRSQHAGDRNRLP
jgi:hypothetical protein